MRDARCWFGGLTALGMLIGAAGCDGGGGAAPSVSSSKAEAKVSGTVKINGKAATGGKITFDPSNINRKDVMPKSADISKDGAYSITTLVGDNRVSVSTPETTKDTKLNMNSKSVDVKDGQSIDIEVP